MGLTVLYNRNPFRGGSEVHVNGNVYRAATPDAPFFIRSDADARALVAGGALVERASGGPYFNAATPEDRPTQGAVPGFVIFDETHAGLLTRNETNDGWLDADGNAVE